MTDADTQAWIDALDGKGGMFEVARETRFHAYRESDLLGTQEVTVVVHDYGPKAGSGRYHVTARNEATGAQATGNPAATMLEAASIVHWEKLESAG